MNRRTERRTSYSAKLQNLLSLCKDKVLSLYRSAIFYVIQKMTSKNKFNSGYNNTLFIRDWSLKKRGFDVIYDSDKLEYVKQIVPFYFSFLQNHQQCSCSDHDASYHRLCCKFFVQKDECQHKRDDYRQLINRNNF